VRRRIDRIEDPIRFLAFVQIAMGVLAVATLPVYARLFGLMQALLQGLEPTTTGYLIFSVASHLMAIAVMLPATFCAGTTLPLVTFALMDGGSGEASIGRVYSFNAAGAIAGALLAIHVALPLLGLKGALLLAAALDVVVGLGLLGTLARRPGRTRAAFAVPAALAAALAVLTVTDLDPALMASGVYRRNVDLTQLRRAEVLGHRDGKTASVSLVRNGGVLSIRTNGKPSASMAITPGVSATSDEVVSTLLGALPLLLRPDARTAVNVGMGSGITSHVLLSAPGLRSLTTVEIEPAMVDLAGGFAPRNRRAFSDERSRIVIDDARSFFATAREPLDIVVVQPSNPWVSGSSALFSQEFYRSVAGRLTPDGILVQWLQVTETDTELVVSILKALASSFGEYSVYVGTGGDLLVAATAAGPVGRLDPRPLRNPGLMAELARVGVRSIQDLEVRQAGDQRTFEPMLRLFDVRANSELFPVVEQRAARSRFMDANAVDVLRIMVQPLPVLEMLGVTAPGWSRTDVTPAPTFFYASRVTTAAAFRDLASAGASAALEGTPEEALEQARRMQHACATAVSADDALSALYGIATAITTDLRPGEMETTWEALAAEPCITGLDTIGHAWLDLFRAMGRRDAPAISRSVPFLLESPSHLTGARTRYLVAAGMLAELAEGRPQGALELWQRFDGQAFPGGEPSFFFRHIVALAEAAPR
jgi:predicted membrane-bound spermidine synthase